MICKYFLQSIERQSFHKNVLNFEEIQFIYLFLLLRSRSRTLCLALFPKDDSLFFSLKSYIFYVLH